MRMRSVAVRAVAPGPSAPHLPADDCVPAMVSLSARPAWACRILLNPPPRRCRVPKRSAQQAVRSATGSCSDSTRERSTIKETTSDDGFQSATGS
jgi:hypothetical protein